jgi:hypothetical protein
MKFCPLGCDPSLYQADLGGSRRGGEARNMNMSAHFVMYHSHEELVLWQINRKYLQLMLGYITYEQFYLENK